MTKTGIYPFVLMMAILTGCAATALPPLSANHPANPNAPAGPLPPPIEAFSIQPPPPPPMIPVAGGDETTSGTAPSTATTQQDEVHPADESPSVAPAADAHVVYTCPMHPQVRSDHPGRCPICGMTLVPVARGKTPDRGKRP